MFWKFFLKNGDGSCKVLTDSNWAGDLETRKSTRGGIIMLGEHCLKIWSTNQSSPALGSCEAESTQWSTVRQEHLEYRRQRKNCALRSRTSLWRQRQISVVQNTFRQGRRWQKYKGFEERLKRVNVHVMLRGSVVKKEEAGQRLHLEDRVWSFGQTLWRGIRRKKVNGGRLIAAADEELWKSSADQPQRCVKHAMSPCCFLRFLA